MHKQKSIPLFARQNIYNRLFQPQKISSLKTPQEVLAVLNKPVHPVMNFKGIDTLVLALEDIRDPGNMGTIIRLADWFGVKDIICSQQCVDCFNPKVCRPPWAAFLG